MIPSPSRKLKSKVRLVRRHLRELETQLLALDENNKNLMSLRRAEINLMSYAIQNSDSQIFQKHKGDVLITISRPPCHRDKGIGCDISYKKHAQQLADNLKKQVTVQWVAGKDGNGNPIYEKSKPFTPGC